MMVTKLRHLDFNLLKAMDILLEERNVTRAAERLFITQPAMSSILARLRESFDDTLFVRSQRGIVPTPRALELINPIKQILGQIDLLLQPLEFNPATVNFTVRIAATDYAHHVISIPFLTALKRQAPNVKISLLPSSDKEQQRLEHGEIDLALSTLEHSYGNDLHYQHLFDEGYICVMRLDHPALQQPLTLDLFCELDHALVSFQGGFLGITDQQLQHLGRQRHVTLSVTSFLLLPEILQNSDLVATVPKRLVCNRKDLAIVPPPLEIPGFSKVALWHNRTEHDPRYRWLRQLMLETCQ
ncbi:LysR family transcriptional regulator [Acinetobacter baumannii]|uniref:LysR family transcriptional regulator n=1 Tax=Acinetobacter baumannii TaxID=470 RepID=UPI00234E2791|nr:LysR family transcriptional regulator [Acinetobacter baumannii]MDC7429290.1 LysR family transcriptional regulator [Acinetobacter baumannii]MDC7466695.1 LysR family transcriptional regulator [Acinetobacter baumannii]